MKNWCAIYVKSRFEKKVAKTLSEKGFSVYCPTRTVLKQWSDRKKKVEEPLFKSYVFVQFEERDRLEMLQTHGVVRLVYWLGEPAVIRNREIQTIKDFLNDHLDVETSQYQVVVGDAVKVNEGGLKNQTGVVVRQKGNRVTLQVDFLGITLHAELPKRAIVKS